MKLFSRETLFKKSENIREKPPQGKPIGAKQKRESIFPPQPHHPPPHHPPPLTLHPSSSTPHPPPLIHHPLPSISYSPRIKPYVWTNLVPIEKNESENKAAFT